MAPSVPSARLLTLGQLALLDGEGRSLVPPGSTKLLGLLAFLAAAPGRRATREHLVDLLWDEPDLKRARASLRTSLHRLRQTLGPDYLPAGDDDITLTDRLACDRDDFLASIAAGDLDRAIAQYGGEYIPGFVSRGSAGFEHWRDGERDRLRSLFAAAAETVAQRALADGTPAVAATLARRLLANEPLNERAWRLRLRAEQQAGSQVHLAGSIAELRRLFAGEALQPDPRTLQLLESLEQPVTADAEPPGSTELVTDLVGREPQLALLYAAWRAASAHRGSHLHLIGRGGLGKSRLLDDFAARLRADRGRVVRARALPRERFVPGALLNSVVGALAGLPGATGMSAQSVRILLPVCPAIANHFPSVTPLEFTDPDARFLAVLAALEDLLGAVSHEGPCCLLLDDAHWWDDHSRRVVEQLIERVATLSVLVVTASRPGHGVISASTTTDTLVLTPLTTEDVLALVQSLGEHADHAALHRLADGLGRAADGVPLLVLEGLRLGLDRGLLGLADRQWCLDQLEEFLAILHPGRLLEERLLLLTPAQRQLLLTAWYVETPLTADDLPLLEADTGTAIDLERLGFLTASHAGWTIAHDAIGEAVEAGSAAELCKAAHRFAGLLARHRGNSPTLLAQAARHFIDAEAEDELTATAVAWLRTQRLEGSQEPAIALLRSLCGPTVPPERLASLHARIPADVRRRPWTVKRLMPVGIAAAVAVLLGGWMVVTREPPADAVVALLTHDSTGAVTESDVALRHREWEHARGPLAVRVVGGTPWSGGLQPDENDLVKDPLRSRWVSFRSVPDGRAEGPTELVLYEGSSATPIGGARGDDAGPSWSPDGTMLAFSTTRWSDPQNPTFDLGVLDVATGTARRLTDGPDADQSAAWSPDGSRIAFTRKSPGAAPDSLCWITLDGQVGRCRGFGDSAGLAAHGWLDGERVLITLVDPSGYQLMVAHLDGGSDRPIELAITKWHTLRLSPDGVWGLLQETSTQGRDAGVTTQLFRLSDPTIRRAVPLPRGERAAQLFWKDFAAPRGIASVAITHQGGALVVGVPSRPALLAVDAAGAEVAVPGPVVRWSSSDTAIATVDSTGAITPRRSGQVTISASVGGWRTASKEFEARLPASRVVWEEDWGQPWPARWRAWGSPEPILVPRASGGWAMLPNGDTEYSSGLFSKKGFDATAGLALDVELETPITQGKWQFLDLALRLNAPMAVSGPMGEGCSLRYPAGEGGRSRELLDGVRVDPAIHSGKPYTLRLQLFPDGSCGIAINGRAFKHDLAVRVAPGTMHVALGGETVASQLLIGRVRVVSGVPTDVDWGSIKR